MRRQRRIAAKPVRYGGLEFRSTLEGRWAVFFDAAGIEWRYEPKWFQLPSGPYLPDFWLPKLRTWIEVKPAYGANAIHKLTELCTFLYDEDPDDWQACLLVTQDNLTTPSVHQLGFGPWQVLPSGDGLIGTASSDFWFVHCPDPECGTNISHLGMQYLVCHHDDSDRYAKCEEDIKRAHDTPFLRAAFQKAQRYRFDGPR